MDDFDFFGGLDIDFDLDDFDLDFDGSNHRYWRPSLDKGSYTRKVTFQSARDFAKGIDLNPGARTYAWVDGSFVFGDIVEALIVERNVGVKELTVSTLSISRENIDSWANCIKFFGCQKLNLLISAYFYSHEKWGMIPYLYDTLDTPGNELQAAYANVHTKIILIETFKGNKYVIHGSANARSSNSVEQLMFEADPDLYDFNYDLICEIINKHKTVNHDYVYGRETWAAVMEGADKHGKRQQPEHGQPAHGQD